MNQWISVNERLPESGALVIAHNADNGLSYAAFRRCGVWLRDAHDPVARVTTNVTHWTPIPELPPKPDPFDAWLAANVSDCSVRAFTRELLRKVWDAAVDSVMRTDH